MKTQISNPAITHLPQRNTYPATTTQRARLLALALVMLALLLVAPMGVRAQSPPSTYDAVTPDGWGFPGLPATTANGSSGLWTFSASLPTAYQYQSREVGCPTCLQEYYWSYDYHAGGLFTLGDGTDTFSGTFTSGYAAGYSEDGGPDVEHLILNLYFTGQWDGPNGPKESGLMHLDEGGEYPFVSGTATLSFAPAPEPGTLLLLGSGVISLAGILRRRVRR